MHGTDRPGKVTKYLLTMTAISERTPLPNSQAA
jgi:hypothetical protein